MLENITIKHLEKLKEDYLDESASFSKDEPGINVLIEKMPEFVPYVLGKLVDMSNSEKEINHYERLLKQYKEVIEGYELGLIKGQRVYDNLNETVNKIKEWRKENVTRYRR